MGKDTVRDHPLYDTWRDMKRRCYKKDRKDYYRYGGRGIKVCDEWRYNIKSFIKWANKNGYKKGLTIDRIDNDGNYEPSNCRLATRKTQGRNKCNVIATVEIAIKIRNEYVKGEITQKELGLRHGVSRDIVNNILNNKSWS